MKKTKTVVEKTGVTPEAEVSTEREISTSKVTPITTGLLCLALAGILSTSDVKAQTADSMTTDTSKTITVKPEVVPKGGVFFIDPQYSPTDKVGTVRLSGGGTIHGMGAGGFLDLTGTQDKPTDVSSAFGKLEITKSTDKVIKGTALDIQYILSSSGSDKIRGGLTYKVKLPEGMIAMKIFPISTKGFDPDMLIGISKSLGKKIALGSFVETDFKDKCFYGETEATYKISKQIDALTQLRYGGTYTSKPKAGAYLGLRVGIK